MAGRLAAAGHDVHLVTYGQGAEAGAGAYRHHRAPRLPGDDSNRSGPNLAKPILDAMLTAVLVRVVRRYAIDVVHAHNYEAAVAALVARRITSAPVVYHSHNLMGDELETYFRSPAARRAAMAVGRMLDRRVPPLADRTIALCDWSAERLRESGTRPERIYVIPPAVEDDGPLDIRPEDRAWLGVADDDFVVGYCGNLDAYQNLPLLLESIAIAARSGQPGPAVRLVVATHSDARALAGTREAAGLANTLRIHTVRGHDEARRALAACDILALPRRLGSGYPVKLLNYMSAAKAIVSAGCGSKILRNGVDGIVVADDDASAMAAAIDYCRRDPGKRRALGEAARQTFLERLTWDRVLPQLESVYEGLREPAGSRGTRTT